MYTVREVAELFGADDETVRRWLRTGRIKGFMPGGQKLGYRIHDSEVERLLNGGPATPGRRLSAVPEAPAATGTAAAHRRAAERLRDQGDEDAARFHDQLADEIEAVERGES
jgi:excisionase family DNA binding protein